MRPCRVVALDELCEHSLEVTLTSDEQPVEALCSCSTDEPLGERIRSGRSDGSLDDSGADGSEYIIERSDELGVPVSDEELDDSTIVVEARCKVARLLSNPASDRMLGHAGQEDLAAFEVDEKQNIEPTKRDRIDGEEVTGERACSLCTEEL